MALYASFKCLHKTDHYRRVFCFGQRSDLAGSSGYCQRLCQTAREVILFKNRSVKELIEKVVQLETHQPVNAYSRMEKAMKKDFTCSLIKDVYGL